MLTFSNIVVVIPAYNPPEGRLIKLVEDLIEQGVRHLIVVNDGSGLGYQTTFAKIRGNPLCVLLEHAVNQGKGRALKTAFTYFLGSYPESPGVVTADADGQHLPADIIKIAQKVAVARGKIILGTRRRAEKKKMPKRRRLGNKLARSASRVLLGQKITDSQSGLRGLPREVVEKCVEIQGRRYEFESNILIAARRYGWQIEEEPIETVYVDKTKSSHFRPLVDSVKIFIRSGRFILFKQSLIKRVKLNLNDSRQERGRNI